MATTELGLLYRELQAAFSTQPSNLQKCGTLLPKLKVLAFTQQTAPVMLIYLLCCIIKIGLSSAGLLVPHGDANLEDLVVARM